MKPFPPFPPATARRDSRPSVYLSGVGSRLHAFAYNGGRLTRPSTAV